MKQDTSANVLENSLDLSAADDYPNAVKIQAVRAYIKRTWDTLRRGHSHILDAAKDSKVEHEQGKSWPVYISRQEDPDDIAGTLKEAMSADFSRIRVEQLPADGEVEDHGLLYLPGDYIVPGGRFNELYGWDSYFIVRGLLQDNEVELAKSVTDQLLYQVEHYGTVLNANRTYFLGRSQPPLLASMVLDIYATTQDASWLASTLPALCDYYQYWMTEPHLDTDSGLSKFYASGEGPAPEVVVSECDEAGRTHFDRIKAYYRDQTVTDYDVSLFYDEDKDKLTDLFFKGDRSMRESGFDPTNRFGPFSVDIIHYLPVCLNALLYKMEKDMIKIHHCLQQTDFSHVVEDKRSETAEQSTTEQSTTEEWEKRAAHRKALIDTYLWDEESGLYMDYSLTESERRQYEFATTFYPLWVGVASPVQAAQVVESIDKFVAPGGMRTSNCISGNQWDAPFGWAPLQLIAVEGLRRYGYEEIAARIAERFITLVVEDFERSGSLLEKYDVENRSGEVSKDIQFGYSSNEIGFGWTNGVLLSLLAVVDRQKKHEQQT